MSYEWATLPNVISKWPRVPFSARPTSVLCWCPSTPTKTWRSTPRTTWSDTAESTSTRSRRTCESTLLQHFFSLITKSSRREQRFSISCFLLPCFPVVKAVCHRLLNTLGCQRLPRRVAQRCIVKYPPGAVTLLRHALAVWPSSVVSPTVGQTWLREADSQCETFPRRWSGRSFSPRPSRPQ